MDTTLSNLVNRALPTAGGSVTYNAAKNMFVTDGYTSGSGHTYFRGIQLSDRVVVVYDIGQGGWGYCPTFLNGVTVYCFEGNQKKIIGKWTPDPWAFYSDSLAISKAADLLFAYLKSQTVLLGLAMNDTDLKEYARCQIKAAVENPKLIA